MKKKLKLSLKPSMEDVEININGVDCMLQQIDTSKAVGPDGLSPFILKNCHSIIAQYLCVIYETTLNTGVVPHDWKITNVVPVHKSGDKKLFENYRPMSLTAICCKLFEHIIYSETVKYLESINFFTPSQHGFRNGRSCITQLVEFQHYFAQSLDSNAQVDAVFLDFRKAFDTVPHNLLEFAMLSANINPKVIIWINGYLNGLQQSVVINGSKSSAVNVTSGVPQGSVLGPLLFLIYINSIVDGVTSPIKLFGDHCVVFREIKSRKDAEILQNDLCRISTWCQNWKLSLNVRKCCCVSFTNRIRKVDITYEINNSIISNESHYKYLGVYFSDNFKWIKHIDMTVTKAGRMLYFIRRNFRQASQTVKQTLYLMYVRSILDYACVIWDPHQQYLIDRLEKIQNQAATFVSNNYNSFPSITEIKQTLGWDPLMVRRQKLRLKFLHSIYYNRNAINPLDYLFAPTYVSNRRDNSRKILEYSYKTHSFGSTFFVKSIQEWNRLPDDIVNETDNEIFFSSL